MLNCLMNHMWMFKLIDFREIIWTSDWTHQLLLTQIKKSNDQASVKLLAILSTINLGCWSVGKNTFVFLARQYNPTCCGFFTFQFSSVFTLKKCNMIKTCRFIYAIFWYRWLSSLSTLSTVSPLKVWKLVDPTLLLDLTKK